MRQSPLALVTGKAPGWLLVQAVLVGIDSLLTPSYIVSNFECERVPNSMEHKYPLSRWDENGKRTYD